MIQLIKTSKLLNRVELDTIIDFVYVDDEGNFHKNGPLSKWEIDQRASKYKYGLGAYSSDIEYVATGNTNSVFNAATNDVAECGNTISFYVW